MEDSRQQDRVGTQKAVTYVKRVTRFARSRPKTSLALLAGAGIIFLPRLTAFSILAIGAATLFAKQTSERTRQLLRERGGEVVQRARRLVPDKVTATMEERLHGARS